MDPRKMTAAGLAALLCASALLACSDAGEPKETAADTTPAGTGTEAVSAEPDPFAELDFGGEEIRILVGNNDYTGSGSSMYTIVHEEETGGDVVRDAVYTRNTFVEDLLNVKFVFTEDTHDWSNVTPELKKLVASGDDVYDLFIHDLFPLATLSAEGNFYNAFRTEYLDFTKDYWYEPYMDDLSFHSPDKRYLLAGDYFLDILRSSHALYFNKEMFSSLYDSPSVLYEHVRNGTWTQETFLNYVADAYQDVNGDGARDVEDRYGYGYIGIWGSYIPWMIGSDIDFLSYDADGTPSYAINNPHSVAVLEKLNQIAYHPSSFNHEKIVTDDVALNNEAFKSGRILFGGYQRVSSLEMFRDMEVEIGILPYPKFDEKQDHYITSSHDTANIGAIPVTCGRPDTISAVLEVLSRETAKTVMPSYYETALKIKYSRDDDSAQMLDIIRYGIENVFPLAYGNFCGNVLWQVFSAPLQHNSNDFASNYAKIEKASSAKLSELWESFSSLEP